MREAVRLPGLTLRPRQGPGPVEGDMPFIDGLYFSGPARKFLDNLRPSRARNGSLARTLSRAEIEEQLARMVALRGIAALNELRDQARRFAPALGADTPLRVSTTSNFTGDQMALALETNDALMVLDDSPAFHATFLCVGVITAASAWIFAQLAPEIRAVKSAETDPSEAH